MSSLNQTTEHYPWSQTKCRLEDDLPVELHIAILLCCPDLETLKALVHASPVCHAAYRKFRNQALFQALCAEYYGMESVDAIVALRSRGLYADTPSNKEKIYALLDQWRRHKEIRHLNLPSAKNLPDEPANFDEIIRLIRLHKIMRFCLNDFCKAVHRPLWIESEEWKNDVLPISLSRTEKTRFLRGLYRVQIYANIFGHREFYPGQEEPSQWEYNKWEEKTFELGEVWRLFISAMAPWEFHEYGCVWQYIYERYRKPYQEIADYFDQFESMPMGFLEDEYQIDPLPANCTVLDSDEVSLHWGHHLSIMTTMGPVFFYKFIREPSFLLRRDTMLVNSTWCVYNFDNVSHASRYPLLYPGFEAPDELKESKGLREIPSPTDRPNIAFQRLYCTETPKFCSWFYMRFWGKDEWKWGYAIWDDERLIEWKRQLSTPLSTPYTTGAAKFHRFPSEDYFIFTRLPSYPE